MLTPTASRVRELTGAESSPEQRLDDGVPVAECCVDPLFGAPSLLHEGARRFASDEADAHVWSRWAAEPEAQKRDVETLVGFYNVALRAAVRPRIEELLLPKAGTDWSGYAHVRELVRQIYFEFDRADCWAWWAPSRGTRPGPQLSRCQLSAASTPATPRAPGRDDSAPGSAERATADTLDYVSERMMREGVLQASCRPRPSVSVSRVGGPCTTWTSPPTARLPCRRFCRGRLPPRQLPSHRRTSPRCPPPRYACGIRGGCCGTS